ncbi:hypothetical protein [Hydrogenophaga sp.]|uniref:hypothetical protein n=1 Tax=Hydrogenophaga sp. TaxID=1904254 RepID=UPI0035B18167
MSQSPTDTLEQFIQDEAAALLSEEQGSFYPDNHHRIHPLLAKASKLLPPAQQTELYFHLLRLNVCPPIRTAAEFDALNAAYTRVTALIGRGYPVCSLPRPKGLFLFGRDARDALDGEPSATQEAYGKLLTVWRYLDGFSHMPGMLNKKARFAELGADFALAERATKVLLQIRLAQDLTSATCLWFWAMVLLALQSPPLGARVVDWLLRAASETPDHRFLLENLARYVSAAGREDLLSRLDGPLKALGDSTG